MQLRSQVNIKSQVGLTAPGLSTIRKSLPGGGEKVERKSVSIAN